MCLNCSIIKRLRSKYIKCTLYNFIYLNKYLYILHISYFLYSNKTGPIAKQLKLNFWGPGLRICSCKSFPRMLRVGIGTWGLEEDEVTIGATSGLGGFDEMLDDFPEGIYFHLG